MKTIIKDLFRINFFKPSILRLFLMDLFKNSYKIQPNLFHIQRAIDWYLKNTAWMKKIITGEYLRFYDEIYGNRSL